MKYGLRRPSLNKRLAARTSWKRYVRHSLGLKAPRGMGWFTNPKKAMYNRVYSRTTFDLFKRPGLSRGRKKMRLQKKSSPPGTIILVTVVLLFILAKLFG